MVCKFGFSGNTQLGNSIPKPQQSGMYFGKDQKHVARSVGEALSSLDAEDVVSLCKKR